MPTNATLPVHHLCIADLKKAIKVWSLAKEKYGEESPKTNRARGIVRGSATVVLTLLRPYDRGNKVAIERLEQEHGMPGPAQGVHALIDGYSREPDVEAYWKQGITE